MQLRSWSWNPNGRWKRKSLLEDTLVANPDLLMPGLNLVDRQTPTAGGPLDLLGVDRSGRLSLFELKRGTLTREAVAQVIDYGADLEAMDLSELAGLLTTESGKRGIDEIEDFEEWYGQRFGEELTSLRPLRLFLVGLGADERAERMVDFLPNNSGMDISLITFHGFAHGGKTLFARQVHVEGATDSESRSGRRYVSAAEKRARLDELVEESGVAGLFGAVREMFGENWRLEHPGHPVVVQRIAARLGRRHGDERQRRRLLAERAAEGGCRALDVALLVLPLRSPAAIR